MTNIWFTMRAFAVLSVSAALFAAPARAQSTAFSYQGRLDDDGLPAEGLYDFRFQLFDAATGGAQVGATLCFDALDVVDGLFSVQLDFGQQFATTAERHLEIEVRREIGQPCTDDFGYALLSPRQLLTATPTASHANSAFALDAADGSPTNAVFVDDTGNVGVGTSTPDMLNYGSRVLSLGGARPRFEFQGSSSTSQNLGIIDFLNDNAGRAAIVVTADDTTNSAHMNFDTKSVWLTGGNGGGLPTSAGAGLRLYFDGTRGNIFSFDYATATPRNLALQEPGGNVGIGTTTPAAKLDVRGDIRLGPTGQLRATAGEENLRIIRGAVNPDGQVLRGSGFTAQRLDVGKYDIVFNTPFLSTPTVTATTERYQSNVPVIGIDFGGLTSTHVRLVTHNAILDEFSDTKFEFIAVGPR